MPFQTSAIGNEVLFLLGYKINNSKAHNIRNVLTAVHVKLFWLLNYRQGLRVDPEFLQIYGILFCIYLLTFQCLKDLSKLLPVTQSGTAESKIKNQLMTHRNVNRKPCVSIYGCAADTFPERTFDAEFYPSKSSFTSMPTDS